MSDITPIRNSLRNAARNGSGLKRLGGTWGEVLAEFLGTFVLLAFGDGVVAMAVAALPGSGRAETNTTIFLAAGDWLLITWGWAFAVAFAVYVAGGISGAHLNPAITLAFAIRRKFAWGKVLPYMAAQVVGAFTGAALVYLVYHDAIDAYNAATKTARDAAGGLATFSIFATFPAPYFHGNMVGPFIDQIVGTMFLVMLVAAVVDMRNLAVKANLGPLIIGSPSPPSGSRTAPTPDTRSTRPVTSDRGCSRGWPVGVMSPCPARSTGRSVGTSGCRSSVRSLAGSSACSSMTGSSATSCTRARALSNPSVEPGTKAPLAPAPPMKTRGAE